jgi:hypothetical protein
VQALQEKVPHFLTAEGLSLDGFQQTYADSAGNVHRDFAILGLKLSDDISSQVDKLPGHVAHQEARASSAASKQAPAAAGSIVTEASGPISNPQPDSLANKVSESSKTSTSVMHVQAPDRELLKHSSPNPTAPAEATIAVHGPGPEFTGPTGKAQYVTPSISLLAPSVYPPASISGPSVAELSSVPADSQQQGEASASLSGPKPASMATHRSEVEPVGAPTGQEQALSATLRQNLVGVAPAPVRLTLSRKLADECRAVPAALGASPPEMCPRPLQERSGPASPSHQQGLSSAVNSAVITHQLPVADMPVPGAHDVFELSPTATPPLPAVADAVTKEVNVPGVKTTRSVARPEQGASVGVAMLQEVVSTKEETAAAKAPPMLKIANPVPENVILPKEATLCVATPSMPVLAKTTQGEVTLPKTGSSALGAPPPPPVTRAKLEEAAVSGALSEMCLPSAAEAVEATHSTWAPGASLSSQLSSDNADDTLTLPFTVPGQSTLNSLSGGPATKQLKHSLGNPTLPSTSEWFTAGSGTFQNSSEWHTASVSTSNVLPPQVKSASPRKSTPGPQERSGRKNGLGAAAPGASQPRSNTGKAMGSTTQPLNSAHVKSPTESRGLQGAKGASPKHTSQGKSDSLASKLRSTGAGLEKSARKPFTGGSVSVTKAGPPDSASEFVATVPAAMHGLVEKDSAEDMPLLLGSSAAHANDALGSGDDQKVAISPDGVGSAAEGASKAAAGAGKGAVFMQEVPAAEDFAEAPAVIAITEAADKVTDSNAETGPMDGPFVEDDVWLTPPSALAETAATESSGGSPAAIASTPQESMEKEAKVRVKFPVAL